MYRIWYGCLVTLVAEGQRGRKRVALVEGVYVVLVGELLLYSVYVYAGG